MPPKSAKGKGKNKAKAKPSGSKKGNQGKQANELSMDEFSKICDDSVAQNEDLDKLPEPFPKPGSHTTKLKEHQAGTATSVVGNPYSPEGVHVHHMHSNKTDSGRVILDEDGNPIEDYVSVNDVNNGKLMAVIPTGGAVHVVLEGRSDHGPIRTRKTGSDGNRSIDNASVSSNDSQPAGTLTAEERERDRLLKYRERVAEQRSIYAVELLKALVATPEPPRRRGVTAFVTAIWNHHIHELKRTVEAINTANIITDNAFALGQAGPYGDEIKKRVVQKAAVWSHDGVIEKLALNEGADKVEIDDLVKELSLFVANTALETTASARGIEASAHGPEASTSGAEASAQGAESSAHGAESSTDPTTRYPLTEKVQEGVLTHETINWANKHDKIYWSAEGPRDFWGTFEKMRKDQNGALEILKSHMAPELAIAKEKGTLAEVESLTAQLSTSLLNGNYLEVVASKKRIMALTKWKQSKGEGSADAQLGPKPRDQRPFLESTQLGAGYYATSRPVNAPEEDFANEDELEDYENQKDELEFESDDEPTVEMAVSVTVEKVSSTEIQTVEEKSEPQPGQDTQVQTEKNFKMHNKKKNKTKNKKKHSKGKKGKKAAGGASYLPDHAKVDLELNVNDDEAVAESPENDEQITADDTINPTTDQPIDSEASIDHLAIAAYLNDGDDIEPTADQTVELNASTEPSSVAAELDDDCNNRQAMVKINKHEGADDTRDEEHQMPSLSDEDDLVCAEKFINMSSSASHVSNRDARSYDSGTPKFLDSGIGSDGGEHGQEEQVPLVLENEPSKPLLMDSCNGSDNKPARPAVMDLYDNSDDENQGALEVDVIEQLFNPTADGEEQPKDVLTPRIMPACEIHSITGLSPGSPGHKKVFFFDDAELVDSPLPSPPMLVESVKSRGLNFFCLDQDLDDSRDIQSPLFVDGPADATEPSNGIEETHGESSLNTGFDVMERFEPIIRDMAATNQAVVRCNERLAEHSEVLAAQNNGLFGRVAHLEARYQEMVATNQALFTQTEVLAVQNNELSRRVAHLEARYRDTDAVLHEVNGLAHDLLHLSMSTTSSLLVPADDQPAQGAQRDEHHGFGGRSVGVEELMKSARRRNSA